MKALILAAGVGQRMMPLTKDKAKCMLEVGQKTILERMLGALSKNKIHDVYLVVGHQGDQIQATFGNQWDSVKLHYLQNDRYQEGSVLSLCAARDVLKDDDFLVMDADVIFDPILLKKLIHSSHANAVLLDGDFQDTGEEMKLGVCQGKVIEISKQMEKRYELVGEGVGFYKIGRDFADSLMQRCTAFVKEDKVQAAYEDVINAWCKDQELGYELVNKLAWIEMDFQEDLAKAEREILPRLGLPSKTGIFCRYLSSKLTPVLIKTSLTPNQITMINFLNGLILLWCFSKGGYLFGVLGALLFQFFYVLDNCDGEVATIKGLKSRFGGWFDFSNDALVHSLLFPAIAVGVYRTTQNSVYLWLALSTMLGIMITFGIFMMMQAKREMGGVKHKPRQKNKMLVKVRDFALLVLVVALFNVLGLLLWAGAIGIHVFWIGVLVFKVREGDF